MNHLRLFIAAFLLPLVAPAASNDDGKLIDAVRRGDHAMVANLLIQGTDVNQSEPDGSTAMLYAAHRNDLEMAQLLLGAGANANVTNAYGANALLEAAAAGNPALLERLLDAGANVNTASPDGETALMNASRSGNAQAVRLLLARGASIDAYETWKGQTALMWAAAGNHAEAVKTLLAHGASVDVRSALVTPEIKHPANGNLVSEQPKGGLTALLLAAREGAVDAARALVQAGANLEFADPDGLTPLIIAIINGHYDTAGMLADAGADANLADRWGRSPIYAAIDMNTLEPSTTRPAPPDSDKLTALDVARILLRRRAVPNPRLLQATPGRGIPDGPDPLLRAGATPFLRAAKTGDIEAMRLLIDHGADSSFMTEQGVTALMAAAGQGWRYGDSQIREADALAGVKFCIELGLDVNAVNQKKETALHGAADRGADLIIQYLAEHGAKLDAKDASGHTAYDVALGGDVRGHPGYPSTAALLKKFGARGENKQ